jgi:hypothetical protein
MKRLSAKNKIIVLVLIWLALSASMFMYFFNFFDVQNQQILDSMADDRKNLVVLQNENQSFKLVQADLQKLAGETYQPADFFTSDIRLVNEVSALESLGQKYGVQMQLSGLSGTVSSQPPAPTVTPMVAITYSVSLNGPLKQVVEFIEDMENLNFVTSVNGLSISVAQDNTVNANLSANFYVQKQ